jgi:hypothetical protein
MSKAIASHVEKLLSEDLSIEDEKTILSKRCADSDDHLSDEARKHLVGLIRFS